MDKLPGQDLNNWQKPLKKVEFWSPDGQAMLEMLIKILISQQHER